MNMEQQRDRLDNHAELTTWFDETQDVSLNDNLEYAQAVCGMCGHALHPELDDIFVELCRACEHTALKGRQTRANVPLSYPKRLPKQ